MQKARLQTIDLCSLGNSDDERSKLFKACQDDGFFYLNLYGTPGGIDDQIAQIYKLQKDLFGLPLAEKMKYDIDLLSPLKLNGYKPVGRNHGEICGRKDGFESYALPKDGILSLSTQPFRRPDVVEKYLSSLQSFCRFISSAIDTILNSLSESLQIKNGPRLQDMHRTHLPTLDLIRLLKYCSLPASEQGASHVPHTDLGSLTFLFTEQSGLQVRRASSDPWEYIEPRPGYAIVNIGDTLSILSGGIFKSCLHRVTAPSANVSRNERYSFAYFCRAEDNTLMVPVSSPLIRCLPSHVKKEQEILTSAQWLQRKYKALRADSWDEKNSWLLTAGR